MIKMLIAFIIGANFGAIIVALMKAGGSDENSGKNK